MPDSMLEPSHYFPCYQPIVDLVTGEISGYEALARYRDDAGELRSAGALFHSPNVDRSDLLAIDRHIRRAALKHFAQNQDAGYVTVNISPEWVERLKGDASPTIAMIEAAGIDPARVVVEITEGQGELSQIQRVVADYHRAGMRVAIDDFGAGASQLDRIEALKPDIIKLDMQLFKKASRGGLTADVTLAATKIAERIGCDIVCEGVETEEELHFGIECGARFIQGYIFHPAQAQLLPPHQTCASARALQQSFLKRKAERLRAMAVHNRSLSESVLHMRQQLLEENTETLSAPELSEQGILRYYLCCADGTQISDNIEVTAQGFECQPWGRSCNWSHRPYFPLLVALETSFTRKLVISDSYRDTMTHKLCRTFGTHLDKNRILLVDVLVNDDVLYVGLDSKGKSTSGAPEIANKTRTRV
ncbi:MAG TPA: EAL domain-containing protein [Cellvibrionaceae bacterium]